MYLKIGTITKQVGLKGEVRIYSTTSFREERYRIGNFVYLFNDVKYDKLEVKTYRMLDKMFDVVSFVGYENIDLTKDLIGKELFAIKTEIELNNDEFFYDDLAGCSIYDEKNELIGKSLSIEEFPAQLTLKCLSKNNKEFYVPFIKEFILNVDLKTKSIKIKVIEGLLWNL